MKCNRYVKYNHIMHNKVYLIYVEVFHPAFFHESGLPSNILAPLPLATAVMVHFMHQLGQNMVSVVWPFPVLWFNHSSHSLARDLGIFPCFKGSEKSNISRRETQQAEELDSNPNLSESTALALLPTLCGQLIYQQVFSISLENNSGWKPRLHLWFNLICWAFSNLLHRTLIQMT